MVMWHCGPGPWLPLTPGGSSPVDVRAAGIQEEKELDPCIFFQGTHPNELMMDSSKFHILEVLLLNT